MSGEALPSLSVELFVIACLFALVVTAALYASARTVRAFRLPALLRVEWAGASSSRQTARSGSASGEIAGTRRTEAERTRAAAVAGMIHSTMLRERSELVGREPGSSSSVGRIVEVRSSDAAAGRPATPLGKSFRRVGARASATAARRDQGA
jgi:hypothetical protein